MITVGGFNTAIDKLADADDVRAGAVVRLRNVRVWPGGKGAHVALAIASLGEPVRLIGLVDAPHAALFDRVLRSFGIDFHPVPTAGTLRTCLAVRSTDGRFTEFLEEGARVDQETVAMFGDLFHASAVESPVAVLTGSLPGDVPDDLYATLLSRLGGLPTRGLVDASGPRLAAALGARPYAVKPNRHEAEELTGRTITDAAAAALTARELSARGVTLAVVSLGSDGFVACWDGVVYAVTAPPQAVRNVVGAGDCVVGGLAVGLARRLDRIETLRLAGACGTAKVLRDETGLLDRRDVERLMGGIKVEELIGGP